MSFDNYVTKSGDIKVIDLNKVAAKAGFELKALPYALRVYLENAVRNGANDEQIKAVFERNKTAEIPYLVTDIRLQDFTGGPLLADLAEMRDKAAELGYDPEIIRPLLRTELVVDHSVQMDVTGVADAMEQNMAIEFKRNKQRYEFFKWAQNSLPGFGITPPGVGIIHQVNLEKLASVFVNMGDVYAPETQYGTDSHTTMISGLGIIGYGVGGIEAEEAMLGQRTEIAIPEIVGVKLTGKLKEGVTATDLVLRVTEELRKLGVVDKIVEYFGDALVTMDIPMRATIANMAPEYGATTGFFPVDGKTIEFLRLTGRDEKLIATVETAAKAGGYWFDAASEPSYEKSIVIDLSSIKPAISGPANPEQRVDLDAASEGFKKSLTETFKVPAEKLGASSGGLEHGSVVIAAITSCTNTSNPSVMIAAGLLAKKAVEKGLTVPTYVKTSLAPGSQVVAQYLKDTGLQDYLDKLRFQDAGHGCATCIGNSGPLRSEIESAIKDAELVVSAVLSGNRNFEARIHAAIKANYLMSPPLVVAYALAGNTKIDISKDPIQNGVYLKDIWPTNEEIAEYMARAVTRETYNSKYAHDKFKEGPEIWRAIKVSPSSTFHWDETSVDVRKPPYLSNYGKPAAITNIKGAKALAILGDNVTTDHISPAGAIPKGSPAEKYLNANGVERKDFNSFGGYRANHEIMVRGTFGNVRVKNLMPALNGKEGGFTIKDGKEMSIYDASMEYQLGGTPLIVIGGKNYGKGSSRDWAAKGTALLGVKFVFAESYERIHRDNLIGMGVVPCLLKEKLTLDGTEIFEIKGLENGLKPKQEITLVIHRANGTVEEVKADSAVRTQKQVGVLQAGGLIPMVFGELVKRGTKRAAV
jgi:aconitate hydratase